MLHRPVSSRCHHKCRRPSSWHPGGEALLPNLELDTVRTISRSTLLGEQRKPED
jgi:hypothetical protein